MQSNVKSGAIRVLAGEDLSDKEGYLVKMTHASGVPEVVLPTANGDDALYVVEDDGEDAEFVDVSPLTPDRQVRIKLEGTCSPGDRLVLADVATPADKGMVRKIPTAAGTYRVLAVAEEAGVDGQLVLARPAHLGLVTVTE